MGIRERLRLGSSGRQDLTDISDIPPLVATVEFGKKIYDPNKVYNIKPDVYPKLVRADGILYACLNNVRLMCRNAYLGVGIRDDPKIKGDREKLQKILDMYDRIWKLEDFFSDSAFLMLQDGNRIGELIEPKLNAESPSQLIWWPLTHTTIHESYATIGRFGGGKNDIEGMQVFDNKYYVFNERNITIPGVRQRAKLRINAIERIRPRESMVHFRINHAGTCSIDKGQRYTFGVWGVSPIEPLTTILLWKQNIMLTDIVFRTKTPMRHHKLASLPFDHRFFEGTPAERKNKALARAKETLNQHARMVENLLEADQDMISLDNVSVDMVEASSAKYMQPNDLINQMDDVICAVIGIPRAALTGGSGTYAGEIITENYAAMRAENTTNDLGDQMVAYIKTDIQRGWPGQFSDEFLNLIFIRTNFVMRRDRSEGMRTAALMSSIKVKDGKGIFTVNEIRAEGGFPPLPGEEGNKLIEFDQIMQQDFGQGPTKSPNDQSNAKKGDPKKNPPSTQESRSQRQNT